MKDEKQHFSFSKKLSIKLQLIPILLCILLIVYCGFLHKDRQIQEHKLQELDNKLKEMESKKTAVDSIKEELEQISKYSAYEFRYTAVMTFSDKNQFMGIDIPLTGNSFVATIDGKMNIGINGEDVELAQTTDADGNVVQATLTVPHSEILDNYTIQDSLEIYDEKNNIFNPVKVADYKELITEAEEKEEKKVLESDILSKSDETIKYLLTSHLQTIYGKDVQIEYTYPDTQD